MPDLHPTHVTLPAVIWMVLALAGIISQLLLYREARLDLEAVTKHRPFRLAETRIARAHVFRSQVSGTIFSIALGIGLWSLYVIQAPHTKPTGHAFAVGASIGLLVTMALLVVISANDYRLRRYLAIPRERPRKTPGA